MGATVNPRIAYPKGNSPITLLQCGVPIGIAPTGTMAANGAVTLGTALQTTYSAGLWLYFPSGAVYSGSAAGFYWTVMSSTTLGTVYNNIYVPGTNSFDIPASPTAIVAAGPGAYTGVTSEITALSVTVPGGLMGKNGCVKTANFFTHPNNANNKILTFKINGSVYSASTRTTSTASRESNLFANSGREDRQQIGVGGVAFTDGTTTVAGPNVASINTAVSVTLSWTLQTAVATDYAILNRMLVEVIPS